MSTYTQIIYHIIFSTKYRRPVLQKGDRDRLFAYMAGTISNKKCNCVIINGVEDHVHILTHLHPSIALADLIKDVKVASSLFIKESGICPGFENWQTGYGAFTHSWSRINTLIKYVKNQEEHHRKKSFKVELRKFLRDNDVPFDEKYF